MKIAIAAAAAALVAAAPAFAKLPVPQLTDEQKVKAEEAKQRAAWSNKVAAYQQCVAEISVAEKYAKWMKSHGKDTKLGDLGACTNPGPFQVADAAPAAAPGAAPAKK